MAYDCVVIGAGISGSVIANLLATEKKFSVLVIEKRDQIAGNLYDFNNDDGLTVQKYGPHIFHTNNEKVWNYLSQFTSWNNYQHKVLACVNDTKVPFPVCIETVEKLHNRPFTEEQFRKYITDCQIHCSNPKNSEEVALSLVGRELYDLFFRNYTKKQWGVYPDQLSPEVIKRIPIRYNRDTRYFADDYQGVPEKGFTSLVENLLNNEKITVMSGTDYKKIIDSIDYKYLFCTCPIDYFFDYKYGKLPYRSIRFEFETINKGYFQEVGVINYPNDFDYTRITEFKYLYSQKNKKTAICYEYATDEGEPFYPVPNPDNAIQYGRYKSDADKLENVFFVGRLAQYKYLNIDAAVDEAMKIFDRKFNR